MNQNLLLQLPQLSQSIGRYFITYIGTERNYVELWVQNNPTEAFIIRNLLLKLQENGRLKNAICNGPVVVKKRYIAMINENDPELYRCVVIAIDGTKSLVKFEDFGSEKWIQSYLLMESNDMISMYQPLARKYYLFGVVPSNSAVWNLNHVQKALNEFLFQTVNGQIMGEANNIPLLKVTNDQSVQIMQMKLLVTGIGSVSYGNYGDLIQEVSPSPLRDDEMMRLMNALHMSPNVVFNDQAKGNDPIFSNKDHDYRETREDYHGVHTFPESECIRPKNTFHKEIHQTDDTKRIHTLQLKDNYEHKRNEKNGIHILEDSKLEIEKDKRAIVSQIKEFGQNDNTKRNSHCNNRMNDEHNSRRDYGREGFDQPAKYDDSVRYKTVPTFNRGFRQNDNTRSDCNDNSQSMQYKDDHNKRRERSNSSSFDQSSRPAFDNRKTESHAKDFHHYDSSKRNYDQNFDRNPKRYDNVSWGHPSHAEAESDRPKTEFPNNVLQRNDDPNRMRFIQKSDDIRKSEKLSLSDDDKVFAICDESNRLVINDHYGVYLITIKKSNLVYCQMMRDEENLEKFVTDLNEYYHSLASNKLQLNESDVKITNTIVAKFSGDQQWYRARIEGLGQNAKSVKLFYIDYGNEETVEVENCRYLVNKFAVIPPFIFKCFVANNHCKDELNVNSQGYVFEILEQKDHSRVKINSYDLTANIPDALKGDDLITYELLQKLITQTV